MLAVGSRRASASAAGRWSEPAQGNHRDVAQAGRGGRPPAASQCSVQSPNRLNIQVEQEQEHTGRCRRPPCWPSSPRAPPCSSTPVAPPRPSPRLVLLSPPPASLSMSRHPCGAGTGAHWTVQEAEGRLSHKFLTRQHKVMATYYVDIFNNTSLTYSDAMDHVS